VIVEAWCAGCGLVQDGTLHWCAVMVHCDACATVTRIHCRRQAFEILEAGGSLWDLDISEPRGD
jgi:hypothetical protein